MSEINPEDLEAFVFPDSLLYKIYDMTGQDENSRGFVLAYVGDKGIPVIQSKAESTIVEMGLRKALEQYLSEVEQLESAAPQRDDFPEDD